MGVRERLSETWVLVCVHRTIISVEQDNLEQSRTGMGPARRSGAG